MLPTLIKIGPVPVHSYGLMIAVGFLAALHMVQREAKKHGVDPQIPNNMAFWGLFLGIAGCRALHILMFPGAYSWRDPIGWIAIWNGGLVFHGALIGPLIYSAFTLRKYQLGFWWSCDRVIPYIPLAHAFGRIGCFLNGCCYGKRTDLPWGVPFPRVPWDLSKPATGSPVFLDHCHRYSELSMSADHWSYPVHPTQLYAVAYLLGICLLLLYLRKRWNPFEGFVLPTYFVLYGVARCLVEFLRGDHNPTVLDVLTQQQVFSLASIGVGVFLLVVLRAWNKRRAESLSSDAARSGRTP